MRSKRLQQLLLLSSIAATSAMAQNPCATPGKDGAGGTLTGVVNTYFPGSGSAAAGATTITLSAAISGGATTAIASGDLLLVIQMQDATINSTNTSAYGSGGTSGAGATSWGTSGQYEYVVAKSAVTTAGGTVTIQGSGTGNGLLYSYSSTSGTTTPRKRFQVVRVPQYTTATLSSGLTAAYWNGLAGGILAVDVQNTLTLGGTVSVDGRGFRGGGGRKLTGASGGSTSDYVRLSSVAYDGSKGEGSAGTPQYTFTVSGSTLANEGADALPSGGMAAGAPANGGGGATDGNPKNNSNNSGGGGGAGAGGGGAGGIPYTSLAIPARGAAAFPAASNKISFGGGGGAGSSDGGSGPKANGLSSSGGAGGGIVILRAGSITGTGTITANGLSADSTYTDGSGGGGGGGSILVYSAAGSVGTLTAQAAGGNGGSNSSTIGTGGGGGSGYVATSGAATIDLTTGANGTNADNINDPTSGATGGSVGTSTTSLTLSQMPGTGGLNSSCGGSTVTVQTTPDAGTCNQLPSNGVQYTQTFTVKNTSAQTESFTLAASNPGPPADLTIVSTNGVAGTNGGTISLGSNATQNVDVVYTVGSSATTGAVDTLKLVATSVSQGTVNDPGTQLVTVVRALLQVTKQVYKDDQVTTINNTTDRVVPGQYIQYKVTVTAQGTAPSQTIHLSDVLPSTLTYVSNTTDAAGWTISQSSGTVTADLSGSLAVGSSRYFWIRARVK